VASETSVPPGWYPDPAGARGWRVWTGERWSEMTRPYGEAPPGPAPGDRVATAVALQRVVRQGAVGLLAGIGLVVSALGHGPASTAPLSDGLRAVLFDAGVVLIALGSVAYGAAAHALAGRLTAVALVPGVNAVAVTAAVNRALRGPGRNYLVALEVAAVVVFAAGARNDPWLGVLPALVAQDLVTSAQRVLARLGSASGRVGP
jgi:hypothetical protein